MMATASTRASKIQKPRLPPSTAFNPFQLYQGVFRVKSWNNLGFNPPILQTRPSPNPDHCEIKIPKLLTTQGLSHVQHGASTCHRCEEAANQLHSHPLSLHSDVQYCTPCFEVMNFESTKRWKGGSTSVKGHRVESCSLCWTEDAEQISSALNCSTQACPHRECHGCVDRLRPGHRRQLENKKALNKFKCMFCVCAAPRKNRYRLQGQTERGRTEWRTVRDNDYQRVRCSPDAYRNDQSEASDHKLKRNFTFGSLLLKYFRHGRRVMVLDNPEALTTKFLISTGLFGKDAAKRIHVPNLNANFEKEAGISFARRASFHHCSLFEFIRDTSLSLADGWDVAADLCCGFNGNQWVIPKADIDLLFRRKVLARHHGVLWLTFSCRGSGLSAEQLQLDVPAFVQERAREFGYQIKLEEMGSYCAMVYFFFVTISDGN
jgi:hypothetical protein